MDTFSYVRPKLTHDVMELIRARGKITRADLNSHFKSTNNVKKNELLSVAIKSLIAYGHVQRNFNQETNVLTLWPTGVQCDLEAMVSKVTQNDVEDYLTQYLSGTARTRRQHESAVEEAVTHGEPLVEETDSAEESTEEASASDEDEAAAEDEDEEAEDAEEEAPTPLNAIQTPSTKFESLQAARNRKISVLDAKDPHYWNNLGRVPELTLDQFILMVAEGKDSFTKEEIEEHVGPARRHYVGTRLAHAVKFNKVKQFIDGSVMRYCLPTKTPVGVQVVGGSVLPAGSSQLVRGVGKLAVVVPQQTQAAPQSAISLPSIPRFGEPVASLSRLGLSLQREDGSVILFTEKEKKELVEFVNNFL